jgi:hypothetical protein
MSFHFWHRLDSASSNMDLMSWSDSCFVLKGGESQPAEATATMNLQTVSQRNVTASYREWQDNYNWYTSSLKFRLLYAKQIWDFIIQISCRQPADIEIDLVATRTGLVKYIGISFR